MRATRHAPIIGKAPRWRHPSDGGRGRLPARLAPGAALTGQLLLPEGPVPFWGRMRSRITMPGNADVVKAIGCEFATTASGRQRLEQFLFGSDLQWILNGYTDSMHTPMSRCMPARIEGPVRNPLAQVRWNAAELGVERGGPAEAVLLSAGADELYIVSPTGLPEQRKPILDVHLRTEAPPRRGATRALQTARARQRRVERARVPDLRGARRHRAARRAAGTGACTSVSPATRSDPARVRRAA